MTELGRGSGTVVAGRYEIERLLGSGGMGNVYRARDLVLEMPVALKVLRRELLADPDALERFRREVKLARQVTDRHIARIFDIGEFENDRFITMELIEGESLRALASRGPLPLERVLEIAGDLCNGLTAVHRAGIVHRDLKPDNVMIAGDGRAVITDFGIARALDAPSTTAVLLGTPQYVAPEQVLENAALDERADLYSFGVMLYELATGAPPFSGRGAMKVVMARLQEPPPDPRAQRPELPSALAAAIRRCMAVEPSERFADVAALRAALAAVPLHPTASEPPPAATAIATANTQMAIETPISSRTARPAPRQKSVAVLPFRNRGGDNDDYLAEAITEELIDNLSMTAGLRVRPRGAVIHLRGVDADPRELVRELEVDVVVEGSVRSVGGSLRVTSRVISFGDGYQIWAKRFERPLSDVLTVADETADAIARALAVELCGYTGLRPEDPATLDLFLRARALSRHIEIEQLERAIALLEQGLELTPQCPATLSELAIASVRRWFLESSDATRWETKARHAGSRALALRPEAGEPRAAMAVIEFQSGNVLAAIEHVRAAFGLPLVPAEVHEIYARIAAELGRLDEAREHLTIAAEMDPEKWFVPVELARIHALQGDWTLCDAILARSSAALGESYGSATFRIRMAIWRRDAEALARAIQSPHIHFADRIKEMLEGGPDNGTMLTSPEQSWRRACFGRQVRAEMFAYIGNIDAAIAEIEAAVELGLFDVSWMARCPVLDEVRRDPRFAALRDTVAVRAGELTAALG